MRFLNLAHTVFIIFTYGCVAQSSDPLELALETADQMENSHEKILRLLEISESFKEIEKQDKALYCIKTATSHLTL